MILIKIYITKVQGFLWDKNGKKPCKPAEIKEKARRGKWEEKEGKKRG